MDLTALCMRLLMDVLVLFVAQVDCSYFAQKADGAFPRVSPERQQFFEYETVTVNCEELSGLTEWRVMRKLHKSIHTNSSNWNSSAPSCTIEPAFQRHSGEYWCENAKKETSGSVNITVTGGSVILEVPVRPVVEGQDVVLQCRTKKTDSKHIADFYKDGLHLGTRYKKNLIIQNVSKSDEGLYKCIISGAGESAETWLAVLKQSEAPHEDNHPVHSDPTDLGSRLWIVVGVLLVALLLLVTGLLLCRKHRGSQSHEDPTVSGEDSLADPHHATYAVVKKQRTEKVSAGDNVVDPDNVTYAVVKNQRKKKDPEVSRSGTNPPLLEQCVYSVVNRGPVIPD